MVHARTTYEESLRRDPSWPEANVGLSAILRDDGDYDQALALCRKALAVRADFSPAYAGLSGAYTELGRLGEAEQALRDAIRCEPANSEAYAPLATLLGRPAGRGS
jgi:tetratricopeptide (TPR) repeat protein